ncbi:MAG: NADAR family protein [Rickettsiales bacterium]|nr:NADAR family protein [Rickettsiales bacterium]
MKKIETFTTTETRFLSNFYPYKNKNGDMYPHIVRVSYGGHNFNCVENAYQAAKAANPDDMLKFIDATPFWAKNFADNGGLAIRKDWDKIKIDVMTGLVWQKFFFNDELKQMLLNTGSAELIEGNTWGDVFWGVCDGKGENHLGKILMRTRAKLEGNLNRFADITGITGITGRAFRAR